MRDSFVVLSIVRAPSRRAASLALVAGLVAVSAPSAVRQTWHRLADVWTLRGENIADARRRSYGDAYWNGIEALREAIPKDGAYFMAVETARDGKACWVRFALAPRRPWLVEKLVDGARVRFEPLRPSDGPEYVVAVRGEGRPPVLLDPDAFWRRAPVVPAERGDDGIPANIDAPAEGARIRGPLVVQGWCQEPGGNPCKEVRFLLDTEPREPVVLERFPRRDIEGVIPGIGDCSTAGYRAVIEGVDPGPHVLSVTFRTGDGRYRSSPPRNFTVER